MHIIHLTLFVVSLHLCVQLLAVSGLQSQTQTQQHQKPMYSCPQMCNCSIYMGLNMANCSGENLISANIGMPSPVECLDISYNDITTLDNECFKNLHQLQTLLLNRNSISFIELDAFSSLTKLNTINLTCNRLESFDNRIFEQNFHLTVVDLSGNKFMHLPNAPILRSSSIEKLDLHKSQLTHLHVNYFAELPNIRFIDLSENLLIVLNLAAFATNNHLHIINVAQNRIKCDEQTEMSIIWLNRNQVNVAIDNCPKKGLTADESVTLKFERISMMPLNNSSHSIFPLQLPTTDVPINLSTTTDLNRIWNVHNENDHNIPILSERCNVNETSIEQACKLFEICITNFTMLIEEVEAKLLLKSSGNSVGNMQIGYDATRLQHSWYEFVSIQVAFYGGLLLGTLLGAILLFILKSISDCVMWSSIEDSDRRLRRKRRNRQVVSSADVCNTSNMNANSDMVSSLSADSLSNERPISRRRQNTTTSRDLMHINNNNNNRNNQQPRSSSTSFFAIFYERPVRHRYYRQINRSATNLVRRLSQSRLILNSSRAQNAAQRSHFTRRTRTDASTAADIPQQQDIEQQSQRATETAVMLNNNDTIDSQQNQNQSDDCLLHRTRASIHSLNISNDCDQNMIENRLSAIRSVASENDLFRNDGRSETPPPPYNVVVHHRKE